MVFKGHVRDGVVVYGSDITLPEGAEVEIVVRDAASPNDANTSNGEDPLRKFRGIADDVPADASVNLDHYLYGHPKR